MFYCKQAVYANNRVKSWIITDMITYVLNAYFGCLLLFFDDLITFHLYLAKQSSSFCSWAPQLIQNFIWSAENNAFFYINKYLIGRFMYKYHTGNVQTIFASFVQQNREIHDYNTRTASPLHIPAVKSDLGKTGIRYHGAPIWNSIYNNWYNTDVSEAVFVKCLKTVIKKKIIPWISQSISLAMNIVNDLFFFPADLKVHLSDISDWDWLSVCVYISYVFHCFKII